MGEHGVDHGRVAVAGCRPRRAALDAAQYSTLGSGAVCSNGWKIVWRQAGPPGSDLIGAMTLTNCARLAAVTRSACLSSEMRRPPTTASVTEYSCSIRRGASGQSAPVPLDWNSLAYQTFHSSKDSASRFVEPRRAPTAYTVLPPISRDEVAARIADGGDPQLLYEIQYVFAESVGVCRRMAGLVDAGVDASAHVFDE
jgi:hypothetical protein